MAERTYVVQIETTREKLALKTLEERGYPAWYVMCVIRRYGTHRRFRSNERRPLIPGYVFTRFDASARLWGEINDCFGVIGIVRNAGGPMPVREADLARLERLGKEHNGVVVIDVPPPRPSHMRVLSGPFAERVYPYLGETDGEITLAIDILGQIVPTPFSAAQVMPA